MSEHTATIDWRRETAEFTYEAYNRDHDWSFDGGVTGRASATTDYRGNARCVDPEEAFPWTRRGWSRTRRSMKSWGTSRRGSSSPRRVNERDLDG